jgi:hypothetical protein
MKMSYGLRCGCCNTLLNRAEQDLLDELGGWCYKCSASSDAVFAGEELYDDMTVEDLKRIFKEGAEYVRTDKKL